MKVSLGNLFIHSLFIKWVILASVSHRQFLLAPNLPLNYPQLPLTDIVTFHLVSGDLRGGNDKNKLLKNAM